MEQRLDYRMDAAELRHRPILQTCCWSFWRYAALHCLVEKQSAFSTNKTWVLFKQRILDSIKLLAGKFGVDGATIRHKFKMPDAFELPPNANHDLLSKLILLRNRWRSLTFEDPTLALIVIDQGDPLLV